MKKINKTIIVIIILILSLFVLSSCGGDKVTGPIVEVRYLASSGGSIIGEMSQSIKEGGDATVVTASPDQDYIFLEWSDGLKSATRQDKEIAQNFSVTALFVKATYEVTYKCSDGGTLHGIISQTVAYGKDSSEIIAVPDEGFKFLKWSDGVAEPSRSEMSVTRNIELTAIFDELRLNVKYHAGEGGYITGLALQEVAYGETTTLVRAVANSGYAFDKWSDNYSVAARTDLIKEDFEVTAIFRLLNKYTVNYSAGAGGSIEGQTEQEVYEGYQGDIVRAVPEAGYAFVKWSDGNTDAARQDIGAEATYNAEFQKIYDGKGTELEPYFISSLVDLTNMRHFPNAYYELTGNIDLASVSYIPVFDDQYRFNGTLDGKNYTISNLLIDKTVRFPSLLGFMGHGSCVKNIKMTGASITVPDYNPGHAIPVGAVASVSNGDFENIHIEGEISADSLQYGSYMIGGLVGISYGKVTDCHSDVDMEFTNVLLTQYLFALNVGGLIGMVDDDVTNCSSKGSINITSDINERGDARNIGGLIGIGGSETPQLISITNCSSEVDISSNCVAFCGGLISYLFQSDNEYYIADSYATGNITITSWNGRAGGFLSVIEVKTDGSVIKNCYATGRIQASNASGFADTISSMYQTIVIETCYSTGDVYGGSRGSGFANSVTAKSIINSYAKCNVTAGNASGFIYSFYGYMKRCFFEGTVQGSNQGIGFIMASNGTIEECYSAGTVKAGKVGTGFAFTPSGTIKNCFSTADVIMTNAPEEAISVSGMAVVNRAEVSNFYYAGKITAYSTASNSVYGAIVMVSHGSIDNCHWLYHEDSPAVQVYGHESVLGVWSRVYRYDSVSEMSDIASLLNDGGEEVWENTGIGNLPHLKNIKN